MAEKNDHFYIDYCPYDQLLSTLYALSQEKYLTSSEIAEIIGDNYRSEIRKRLVLLELAVEKVINNSTTLCLTPRGIKVKEIANFDPDLLPEIIHYLHMSYDPNNSSSPKMLWSYSQCSMYLWNTEELSNYKVISAFVQNRMIEEFPHLDFTASVGARFDHYAVGRWSAYIQKLSPSPVDKNKLIKRDIPRYEIVLLSLDDFYRRHQLRYGDPVVLSDKVLDEISSVFFLNPDCTKQLITIATKLSPLLSVRDTFAGMAISLKEHYSIERL